MLFDALRVEHILKVVEWSSGWKRTIVALINFVIGVTGDKNKVYAHLQKWKIQIGTRDCNEIWHVWSVEGN